MFNIDAGELILIIVLGVVMFGPEKLPSFARKVARVFVAIRDMANNAQGQLREELGPEFSDLKLEDLNPKKFVAKHMREEIQAIEDARREISEATTSVKGAATQATSATASSTSQAGVGAAEETPALPPAVPDAPFDPEAT